VLDLFDNHVGDAGVAHLGASFPALQQLDLGANKITDAGVRPAALLPSCGGTADHAAARVPVRAACCGGACQAQSLVRWLEDLAVSPDLVELQTAGNEITSVSAWDELAKRLKPLRPALDWTYRRTNEEDEETNQFLAAAPWAAGPGSGSGGLPLPQP